jgi:hypothetical protein
MKSEEEIQQKKLQTLKNLASSSALQQKRKPLNLVSTSSLSVAAPDSPTAMLVSASPHTMMATALFP